MYTAHTSWRSNRLVQAIDVPIPVYESFGARPGDMAKRIDAFVDHVIAHMEMAEPQLRAALRLSLEQYAKAQAGELDDDDRPRARPAHRVDRKRD